MRAVLACAVLAACAPDIAPGVYICGPEQLCPDGLVCDGAEAVCVNEATALPFACGPEHVDVPGDDAPATAQSLGDLTCNSLVVEAISCLPGGDAGDFYTFRVLDGCTTARLRASVIYPVAFQRVVLQLAKVGEAPMTIDTECPPRNLDAGAAASCLDAAIAPGEYVIGVVPDGTGTCDGACAFNRYSLGLQISTP